MPSERTVKLHIHGRVQGVFYRANTRDRARELGLRGWVRNLPDGTVETLASGPDDAVEKLVSWCREGPTQARVDRVEVEPGDNADVPDDFEIRTS